MRTATVVGAGIFGLCCAYQLALRGWKVVLIEKHEPGHARATSAGDSRLLRLSHGADDVLTAWALSAAEFWESLGALTGTRLFERCGVLWFVTGDGEWEQRSATTLSHHGVDTRRLTVDEMAAVFPTFDGSDLDWGLLEPEGGVLRARQALSALTTELTTLGVSVVSGTASPSVDGAVVDGELSRTECTIWACGPWLASIFPDRVGLRVTRQDEVYVAGDRGWALSRVPAWIDFDRGFYGVGDVDGLGIKLGVDVAGAEIDPDRIDRMLDPGRVSRARELVGHRFPGLGDSPVLGGRVCQYEFTSDSNPIAAPLVEGDTRQWVAGGGSGQGFKHAPVLATHMVDLVEGQVGPQPRFTLGMRSEGHATDMRTAASRRVLRQ